MLMIDILKKFSENIWVSWGVIFERLGVEMTLGPSAGFQSLVIRAWTIIRHRD